MSEKIESATRVQIQYKDVFSLPALIPPGKSWIHPFSLPIMRKKLKVAFRLGMAITLGEGEL